MKIQKTEINTLIPYVNNARIHSEAQIAQIAASIKEFGFNNPILCDGDNGIIAGHGRLLAAQKLALKEVPVIELSHLSETQKKAYILADNKIADNAEFDIELVSLELESLGDIDVEITGFDIDDIITPDNQGLTDEDEVPEVEESTCKLGDLWQLGNHKMLCGDSTDIEQVELLMGGLKPNAVFTDPPYGIGLDKDKQKLGKSKEYNAVLNDNNTVVAKKGFALVASLNVPELYFWGANHYSSCLPDSTCWVVWDKQGGKSVTYADCELCYTNIKKPVRMFTHIWDGFRRDSEKGNDRTHPTQKPVKLFIDIWEKFNTGQVLLDLFLGSGSTLIACEKTNRKCYGMELDPHYCDVIIQRYVDYTGDNQLTRNGEDFIWKN